MPANSAHVEAYMIDWSTYLACDRRSGKRALQTFSVPQKLVLTVTSACSENGVGEAI